MFLSLSILTFAAITALVSGSTPFDPTVYAKQKVNCKVDLATDSEIQIYYVDLNPTARKTVVLVHGWPSLWSTWSNQIQALQNDYRVVVPDLPGFGSSTHPGNGRGNMGDLVGDVVCVLQHAGVASVACVGHDWGSQICFEGARSRPDIFIAAAGTIPYIHAAGPFLSIAQLVPALPRLNYQLFFDRQTESAIAELNKDIRRTLRVTLRASTSPVPPRFLTNPNSFMAEWDEFTEIPPPIQFFTPHEEDYIVQQFSIQKFDHTLYFYNNTNRFASWDFAHKQGNHTITKPVLWIFPLDDSVANWETTATLLQSAQFVPHLTVKTLHGSHWPQLENPEQFNRFLVDWLADVVFVAEPDERRAHRPDEL